MNVGKGGPVVSWAHQRSRELADQLLDDAYSFRQRCADCADALRRAGALILDAVFDLPAGCRRTYGKIAEASYLAAAKAVDAVLDLAWLLKKGAVGIYAQRRRIAALTVVPLIPVFAVLAFLSTGTPEGSVRTVAPRVARDASSVLVVSSVPEVVRPRAHAPARPARAKVVRSAPVATTAAPAVAHRATPPRAAARPKPATPVTRAKPPRRPSPRAGARKVLAPAEKIRPVPAVAPAVARQPSQPAPPAQPVVATAAAVAPSPTAAPPTVLAQGDQDDRGEDADREDGDRHDRDREQQPRDREGGHRDGDDDHERGDSRHHGDD